MIAALRTVASGVGETALALLQAPQPPPIETVLTALLNDLGATAAEIVLVLDDYHVIDARDVQDGMAFLLDHLPPWLHVVIASRADPALPLPRWRARGELVETRAAELRFTPDEAAAYLNEMMGLQLTARDVAALEGAPRAGSPRSSWRRCRCRAETTWPASSPASLAMIATSWTTWSRRCCSASPIVSRLSCCRPLSWAG